MGPSFRRSVLRFTACLVAIGVAFAVVGWLAQRLAVDPVLSRFAVAITTAWFVGGFVILGAVYLYLRHSRATRDAHDGIQTEPVVTATQPQASRQAQVQAPTPTQTQPITQIAK